MKMVDLYHDLTIDPKGCAPAPRKPPSVLESFLKMSSDHGACAFADLEPVYSYLRGNKHLCIPDQWRPFIPKTWGP